jgi:demethylmenaquinone methyltransferase/2-methoxy-6-polyprenyl-1,4-benzoquinol methylase
MAEKVVPYGEEKGSKRQQVEEMFDNISPKYDFLNHFLSAGIDKRWRKKAINLLKPHAPKQILDVATGTADLAIEALKLNPEQVTGVDISAGMLSIGRQKIEKAGLNERIQLQQADSENLPFTENTFDATTVAFGVRNFERLEVGLKEIFRTLKPAGWLVVLEFSKPKAFPVKQLYHFYFTRLLPTIGRLVSRDNSAYSYLPASVQAFPEGEDFKQILKKTGFRNIEVHPLLFGIASIYKAQK